MNKTITLLKKQPKLTFNLFLVLVIVVIALLAPVIAPFDPLKGKLADAYQAPSLTHLCGTDAFGRDIFSRILYGTRISVGSAFLLVCGSLIIGMLLGIIGGYFGGVIDAVIMRLSEIMMAFPGNILAMAIVGILGPSFRNAIISILVVSWTHYSRLARSLVLKIKNRDYIKAAKITGSKHWHIILSYMLPNALPQLVVTAAMDIGVMMLVLSGLSFLGFGIQPPTPEWGSMLNEGRSYLQTHPWMIMFPGLAVFFTVVVFNLLGDSIRDLLDPKAKNKKSKRKMRKRGTKK